MITNLQREIIETLVSNFCIDIGVIRMSSEEIKLVDKIMELLTKIQIQERQRLEQRVGLLRQWLNEDHITDTGKMVSNEDILMWLRDKLELIEK